MIDIPCDYELCAWIRNSYCLAFLLFIGGIYAIIFIVGLILLIIGLLLDLRLDQLTARYYGYNIDDSIIDKSQQHGAEVSPVCEHENGFLGNNDKHKDGRSSRKTVEHPRSKAKTTEFSKTPAAAVVAAANSFKREKGKGRSRRIKGDLGFVLSMQFYLATLIEAVLPERTLTALHFSSLHKLTSIYEFIKFNAYYQSYINLMVIILFLISSDVYLYAQVFAIVECESLYSQSACTKTKNYLSMDSISICKWKDGTCSINYDISFTNESLFIMGTIAMLLHMLLFYAFDHLFVSYFDGISRGEVLDHCSEHAHLVFHEHMANEKSKGMKTCCKSNKVMDESKVGSKFGVILSEYGEGLLANHSSIAASKNTNYPTGSFPPFAHGWQRTILLSPSQPPRNMPYFSMA